MSEDITHRWHRLHVQGVEAEDKPVEMKFSCLLFALSELVISSEGASGMVKAAIDNLINYTTLLVASMETGTLDAEATIEHLDSLTNLLREKTAG